MSGSGTSNKFAVMSPHFDNSEQIQFGFKINVDLLLFTIKEIKNWLAVGMCHLDTVQAKGFIFNY